MMVTMITHYDPGAKALTEIAARVVLEHGLHEREEFTLPMLEYLRTAHRCSYCRGYSQHQHDAHDTPLTKDPHDTTLIAHTHTCLATRPYWDMFYPCWTFWSVDRVPLLALACSVECALQVQTDQFHPGRLLPRDQVVLASPDVG